VFGETPFTLHRQQPEKDKQNVNVAPLQEKFLRKTIYQISKGGYPSQIEERL